MACNQIPHDPMFCHYHRLFHLPVSNSVLVLELEENKNVELGALEILNLVKKQCVLIYLSFQLLSLNKCSNLLRCV